MKDNPAKNLPNGFIPIPFLILVLIIGAVATAIKVVDNPHVLGSSVFLAENGDGTGPAPGGGGGGGGSAPAPAPQQQSQPSQPQESQPQPQQQPQQQNNPQPGSGGGGQGPAGQQPPQNTQNTGPAGSGQGGPQGNNPNPGIPQGNYRPLNQQNRGSEQNPRPGTPQEQFRPLTNQQNTGPAGNGQGGPQGNNPQDQQRFQQFQQFQQQWQQDASKFGFQIQTNPAGGNRESGSNNQGNPGNGQMPPINSFPTIQGNFNVGALGNGGGQQQINLNDGNTKITLGSFKAVKPDGSQFNIDKSAVEKINAAIKLETGSDISQNGNTFVMKRGDVSASTDLPISFNIATKTFTVQTGSGEQEVKVLPDEAVAKIQEANANFSANSSNVQLTEFNNQPVYKVEGTDKQKLLGILPVSISQTTVVSAQNGNVVTTNQSIVSRILDVLSF